jgi:pilus assembly protein CpaE
MTGPLHILIVGADLQLAEECRAALAGMSGDAPVMHRASSARQAVDAARNRRPALAVIEMGTDLAKLKALAGDLAAASPETLVTAAFRPEAFGNDVSESAILIEALRAGVRDFLRRPVSAADLNQLVERLQRAGAPSPARWGVLASFISNKGGVGKSTLAVNAALGLAQLRPERVLLIDASLQMGVCAAMLDLQPQFTLTDAARERERLDELLIRQLATPHESGLHLLAAPADAMEGAEVDDEVVSRVLTLARRAYDYVIVDTFPIFDSVVMAVLDVSDRAYVVLENVVPTLLGATKLLKLLDAVNFPRERQDIVLNRFALHSGNLKLADVALRLDRDIDHVVSYDRGLIAAANLGRPFLARAGRFSRPRKQLLEIVRDLGQLPRTRSIVDAQLAPDAEANGRPHG